VTVDDPAHVTRLVRAQDVGRLPLRAGVQDALDHVHGVHETALLGSGEPAHDLADVLVRAPLERREGGLPARGELEVALPPVGLGAGTGDETALLEIAEDAA